jgi:dihydrodipicolinate synthase/N-acetylneuraminate lyase
MSEMFAAYHQGLVAEATALNATMIPSYVYESYLDAPNPVPTKVMMNLLGQPVGECRSPMGPVPDDLPDRARAVLAELGRTATIVSGSPEPNALASSSAGQGAA